MARKSLYKHSYGLGENTRDNPTSISFNSCQILENLKPGDPNPVPRGGSELFGDGIGPWGGSGYVRHIFNYEKVDGDLAICISDDGYYTYFYTKDSNGVNILIHTDSVGDDFSSLDLCFLRIQNDVYVSNGLNRTAILEYQGYNTFYFRNSNIQRPDQDVYPNLQLSSVLGGGNLTAGKYIGYAVTYVRRTDAGSMDEYGDPIRQTFNNGDDVYHPGVLESKEIQYRTNAPGLLGDRVAISVLTGYLQHTLTASNLDDLDEQVTHVRFYRSLEFDTIDEAKAASMRWMVDIPVKGDNTEVVSSQVEYVNNFTNDTMAGNFNLSINIGMDDMPAGKQMFYHAGRIWVGEVAEGYSERRGRVFYSIPTLDPLHPQKWYSMFLTGNASLNIGKKLDGVGTEISGWKDLSQEDSETLEIIGTSGNDIVFVCSRTVWYLPDGDPETFEPELMDKTTGTSFSNTGVYVKGNLHYLSNYGPARIVGRDVEIIEDHTAGEVWPDIYDGSQGYFFGLEDPRLVKGYYVRENWILADDVHAVCLYMPEKKTGFGPWRFKPADGKDIGFGIGAAFNDKQLLVTKYNTPSSLIYSVLDPLLNTDDGADFALRSKSKALYMSDQKRNMFGEVASLMMFVEFTDTGQLLLILHSDYTRISSTWTYTQRSASDLLQAQSASDNNFRLNVFQPILEGFIGQHFEVEFVKIYSTPYRFITKGFDLDTIIRLKGPEFVSKIGDSGFGGDIVETGVSAYDIIESGDKTYNIIEGE